MKVPLLDLVRQYESIRGEVDAAVAAVFRSQQFILGPQVTACEEAVARYSSCAHAVGVSSGSDALLVAMMARGIGPGDEVITTPYSFFATAGSVARLGARPMFVDIEPGTFNINAGLIRAVITSRTKAIIPVHLYGQMADMDAIMELGRTYRLAVIEDAAQAIGAEWRGRRAGSMGDCGCLSFFPSKNLGGAGDGGMIVTNNQAFSEKVRCLRNHGSEPKYYHRILGGNFRLDALQAAVVAVKLKYLDVWTDARRANAARYDRLFAEKNLAGSGGPVVLPTVVAGRHIFNQYVIRVPRRDELRKFLAGRDVATEVYYPVPLHLQECFAGLGYRPGDFPESEAAAATSLALPIYPEVTGEQAAYVVDCIADFFS